FMDVIAAIATGSATTAIGIVRVAGEGCFALCNQIFRAANGRPFSDQAPRSMVLGEVLDAAGGVLDHGLAVRFPAPHSYTGEDCAEFHCHGSPVVLREVLSALFAVGARQARAGEFTRRAFLNGQLDLTQAEAVSDLIAAETAAAAKHAAAQLDGVLRRDFEDIYNRLLDISAQFYAVVDYPDEDIADLDLTELSAALETSEATLSRLLATCDRGRVLKSGVPAVILGRPNVGKSSLLNALLGYDRAIVTATAGTTRDTVEEPLLLGGVLLRLTDTAGLRQTQDPIEAQGVTRAKAAAERAELSLLVLDGSAPATEEDRLALSIALTAPHCIAVVNKSDLPPCLDAAALSPGFSAVLSVCAKTGEGLSALDAAVAALYPAGEIPPGEILTTQRQQETAGRARDAIRRGREALLAGFTPDAILSDVEEALSALGEMTGKTAREEIVSRIFERFCVGK
ncbi:MAG: tRNA uridine-5-carboxymethylaminomethyl(34) synthesis GTPase MnmE, partial [Oscillibacter sp.]